MEHNDMIFGIRALLEAVDAGKEIDKILVKKDLQGELAQELFAAIKGLDIPVQRVPIEKLNRITRKNHQGVIAFISPVAYQHIDNIVPSLYEVGKVPFIVLLDGLTDVRNFGAIARTCECAGVDAIVIPERGSVSVTADAVKTSAGALLHIPVCRERSIADTLQYLQECGIKIVAASEKASVAYTAEDYTTPIAIVMGAEDVGISPQAMRLCEAQVALPQKGRIGSLNVSVAAGVMIYEVLRQRSAE
ncbi:MAG: 23S rRNA (guanosine(2251)-2'-O)-methyltransferase RlmB [Coprobacter sp.]|nr:23S rRNA (guanosine(2251)-2'-O)-methyltransferase RlmB [Coprobacter sp.]